MNRPTNFVFFLLPHVLETLISLDSPSKVRPLYHTAGGGRIFADGEPLQECCHQNVYGGN